MHEYWDVRPLCFYRSSIEGRSVLTQGMELPHACILDVRPPCFYRPSIEGRSVLTQGLHVFCLRGTEKNLLEKNKRKLRTSSRHSCRGFFLFNFFHAFRMILGFVQIYKH